MFYEDNFGTVWIYIEAMEYCLFARVFCQVHFMDSSSPSFTKSMKSIHIATIFGYLIPRWLRNQFALQNCKVSHCWIVNSMFAKSTSAACQLHFAKLPMSTSPCGLLAWMGGCCNSGCCKDLGVQGRSLG